MSGFTICAQLFKDSYRLTVKASKKGAKHHYLEGYVSLQAAKIDIERVREHLKVNKRLYGFHQTLEEEEWLHPTKKKYFNDRLTILQNRKSKNDEFIAHLQKHVYGGTCFELTILP